MRKKLFISVLLFLPIAVFTSSNASSSSSSSSSTSSSSSSHSTNVSNSQNNEILLYFKKGTAERLKVKDICEQLDGKKEDLFSGDSFQEMIDRGVGYPERRIIIARIVDITSNNLYYFDAYGINKQLFNHAVPDLYSFAMPQSPIAFQSDFGSNNANKPVNPYNNQQISSIVYFMQDAESKQKFNELISQRDLLELIKQQFIDKGVGNSNTQDIRNELLEHLQNNAANFALIFANKAQALREKFPGLKADANLLEMHYHELIDPNVTAQYFLGLLDHKIKSLLDVAECDKERCESLSERINKVSNCVADFAKKSSSAELKLDCNELRPLHLASYYGSKFLAQYLIQDGADVDVVNKCGFSPLHLACMRGNLEVAKYLIDNGASVGLQTKVLPPPIFIACSKEQFKILDLLLEKKADINFRSRAGRTVLDIACNFGSFNVVQYLVEHGAHVNPSDSPIGFTPLFFACLRGGDLQKIKYLIKNGADVNAKLSTGVTILSCLCKEGNIELVEYLLKHGVTIDDRAIKDAEGNDAILKLLKDAKNKNK